MIGIDVGGTFTDAVLLADAELAARNCRLSRAVLAAALD
jgi:N-methylhydantoinase A/oxoprolinase/acetone carboxylase beta subunit